MPKSAAEQLMARETRVFYGKVPDRLHGDALVDMAWQIARDEFLLRGEGDHYFHYRRGVGITIHRGAGAEVCEEPLWLNGTLYAAIASMNGLLPIHASAIAFDNSVYAFTGPAGSGKSTLIAALGSCGIPMFCDDTLILDLGNPERVICLPGHKRLKLTPEAIALTGANPETQVGAALGKSYCTPPSGEVGVTLPLAQLIFLEEGPEATIETVSGFERFERMQDDHYTAELYANAQGFDRAGRFAHLSQLANRVPSARFARPRDLSRFHNGVSVIADYLSRQDRRSTARGLTKLADRFSETLHGDEIIITQLDRGEFLRLTGTAATTWRLMDGQRNRTALIAALMREFVPHHSNIAADVDAFLIQLRQFGLLADD